MFFTCFIDHNYGSDQVPAFDDLKPLLLINLKRQRTSPTMTRYIKSNRIRVVQANYHE
ncbi:hypothetical protein T02_10268 [Trichinella nativa]|uniref:Uncharacterized protein n=1 Tax=Trichinella nativa TaxID=6335 RepID=A0A0V1KJG7_9BILA|nr:hypothetical protein T02_10268 [Trichinella nativa]